MADTSGFAQLVPGFDFLQSLVKNAGSAIPSMGQWVAPTLSPEEIEKRIDELKTVQFWLEQNARMLAATIQALEVQRMTLATLKTMNVQMGDLRDSLKIHVPSRASAPAAPKAAVPEPAEEAPPASAQAAGGSGETAAAGGATPPPGVDPMQWWGALTKQFTQLAASAIQEGAAVGKQAAAAAKSAGTAVAKKAAAPAAKKTAAGKKAAPRPAAKKRATPAPKG